MQYIVGFVSPGSAKADNGCGGKLDSHLIASCVGNTGVKNYQNLVILLKVTIKNGRDVFFQKWCIYRTFTKEKVLSQHDIS